MLALLVCTDRSCRASFEAEGAREAVFALRCEDCGSDLRAVGWADGDGRERAASDVSVRRAA